MLMFSSNTVIMHAGKLKFSVLLGLGMSCVLKTAGLTRLRVSTMDKSKKIFCQPCVSKNVWAY